MEHVKHAAMFAVGVWASVVVLRLVLNTTGLATTLGSTFTV